MANKFRYAVIDVKGFLKDFHKMAEDWDDNFIKVVHLAVLNEFRCRIGQQTWAKFYDDFKPCSAVVGSKNAKWMNEVR